MICLKNNKKNSIKIKDFVNEIIYNENKKSINHLLASTNEELNLIKANKELLTEPTIFIRKWIGEVIVFLHYTLHYISNGTL